MTIKTKANKIVKLCTIFCFLLMLNSSYALGMTDDERRPPEHFCPITLARMQDPVVAADGNTYERISIATHFRQRQTSPLTNLPIETTLIPNNALKKMIDEWHFGGVARSSAFEGRSATSIVEKIREEFQTNAVLLGSDHDARDRDIVAVIGNTGAGKSTLVNLLAGKELVVSPDGEDYVLAHPEDPEAMAIGTTGRSQTMYPKSIDVEGLRIFDLPGFNDADGSERNLVNAALIRHILTSARSVRLLVVAGQDQFTSDRSASIKHLMQAIQNLFVVGEQDQDLLNSALFVATKVTAASADVDFLLKKADARDKEALGHQLQTWKSANQLMTMFHPLRDAEGSKKARLRDDLIARLQQPSRHAKIRSLNVSALYPPETVADLKRMFLEVMDTELSDYLQKPLTTVSDYDHEITFCGEGDFWTIFEGNLCARDNAVRILKEFGAAPYAQALRDFIRTHEQRRVGHLEELSERRQARIEDMQMHTQARFKEVIRALPQEDEHDLVFDFAHHKDFYEAVCGQEMLPRLATDPKEQEIVRQQCTGLINHHARTQIERAITESPLVRALMDRAVTESPLVRALLERVATLERRAQEEAAAAAVPAAAIARPLPLAIPDIARGHEAVYRRFVGGRLIYRPTPGSDEGRIDLPIATLADPLMGTFDLSRCSDTGQCLSISTGYRKGKKAENANKLEVWLAPRFLIERDLEGPASHFRPIMGGWSVDAPAGVFWTWGGWYDLGWYDYLTSNSLDQLGDNNLYEKETHAAHRRPHPHVPSVHDMREHASFLVHFKS